jgi:hypothetical protein
MSSTPPVLPFGARGNTTGGNSVNGPEAAASSATPEDCRFDTEGFPFKGETPTPDPTPATVYKLTDCDTGESRYTTEALTTGISAEVDRVVKVAEYSGQCWQAVSLANPGSAVTEALTISSSTPICGTCSDPVPCTLPSGNPPAGMATVYQSLSPVNVGAGLTWEDYNNSASNHTTPETIRWSWSAGRWVGVFDNSGPGGVTWSIAADGRWFIVDHNSDGSTPPSNPFRYLNIYTKAAVKAEVDSSVWELAAGRSLDEIDDGACVWGLCINTWTENAALGRKGFLYLKIPGTTPTGLYTWFMSGPELKLTGTQPYYEAPQTVITLIGIS